MTTTPLFQFDTKTLDKIQEALPADLQLLRLRLRFGLPVQVHLGQRFRVVVDLVDEMGQPFTGTVAPHAGIKLSIDTDHLVLRVESTVADIKQRAQWVHWVSLQSPTTTEDFPDNWFDAHIGLRIQMKQGAVGENDSMAPGGFRHVFQSFCVGSAWLNASVLVLPLQVQLQVAAPSEVNEAVTSSTICQRLFHASSLEISERGDDKGTVLVVEENYGDAMGSHVWDASVLLSFSVLHAGTTGLTLSEEELVTGVLETKQVMLELGSGCGLFAAVLSNLLPLGTDVATIFTEKHESTERLQSNLLRNRSLPTASVVALDWGAELPIILLHANIRVVFAADVLYNWAAHEALIATLDSLFNGQVPTSTRVFLAHKRRGKSSAMKLDALASNTFDAATDCGVTTEITECRWNRWHVEKIASIGRVDLFQLSRRYLQPEAV
ncbi:unnamed protein product [Phytophthora lilii]|uniref:Unnamed protein product n=1 Tax=Phytophthora lilii TaxID=2077276 RepID=A0A9W6TII9_9STRA|nr:unnamed protein product [Phytophthora lilii]